MFRTAHKPTPKDCENIAKDLLEASQLLDRALTKIKSIDRNDKPPQIALFLEQCECKITTANEAVVEEHSAMFWMQFLNPALVEIGGGK